MTRVPYPYWNLKLRDDSNILEIANSIASESSGHLFSELLSASRTNLSAVSPINTGIVFIDIAIILSFCGAKIRNFRYLRKDLLKNYTNCPNYPNSLSHEYPSNPSNPCSKIKLSPSLSCSF